MRWLTPQAREFAPGHQGTIVVLADHSGSISNHALMAVSHALNRLRRHIPSARLFAFHADIAEVPADHDFFGTWPPTGAENQTRFGQNTTDLGHCFSRIASLKPSKTILISDGACRNKRNTLKVVTAMTGSVDAFFCQPDPAHYAENYATGHSAAEMFRLYTADADEGLMQQIARCGRGRFVRFHPERTDLARELATSTAHIHEVQQMARPPRVNIVAPGPQFVDARQHVHVRHGVVVHHHHAATEHVEHGQPAEDVNIEVAAAQVTLTHRPGIGGFLMDMLTGPRTVDRGALQAAPPVQQIGTSRQAAQIEAPKGGAMPSQMPTIAGVPAHLLTKKGG